MWEETTMYGMHKLLSTVVLGAFLVFFALSSDAGAPFDPQALAAAQATGKPVLVEVFADWCSTCAQQRSVLSELLRQTAYRDYQVLTVDFDQQKDALKLLGVRDRSTLIVYKGKEEKGRVTWETSRDGIAALLNKAI
jgi:thiol:disulfide interchange protein